MGTKLCNKCFPYDGVDRALISTQIVLPCERCGCSDGDDYGNRKVQHFLTDPRSEQKIRSDLVVDTDDLMKRFLYLDSSEPIFEVSRRDGSTFQIFADGRIAGGRDYAVVRNRITPLLDALRALAKRKLNA